MHHTQWIKNMLAKTIIQIPIILCPVSLKTESDSDLEKQKNVAEWKKNCSILGKKNLK